MLKNLSLVLLLVFIAGCGTYNSRNVMEVTGKSMTFSYGLIACKDVDRILILRETNAGKGEAKNNLEGISGYLNTQCKVNILEETVKESNVLEIIKENADN